MTGKKYRKLMFALGCELERAASAEPYDPGAHGDVVTKINNLNRQWSDSLGRRHTFFVIMLWICFVVVVGIIIRIFC